MCPASVIIATACINLTIRGYMNKHEAADHVNPPVAKSIEEYRTMLSMKSTIKKDALFLVMVVCRQKWDR
ncbi:hypothetical protein ALC53_07431 [Atta colombica]|uniref:Uncharacterized protein n=1 Tax=Atta colombica TaxID=520822 RepID=A0A195BCA4_9HYME|nr:hypothetical protein ALC53_07431 [Atta colombica]